MIRKPYHLITILMLIMIGNLAAQNQNPVIDTVYAAQRNGSFLVDIYYKVSDAENDDLVIYGQVSNDSGRTFTVPARSFSGDYGFGIRPGADKHIEWDAGKDFPEQYGQKFRVKLTASDLKWGEIVTIPAGSFWMGDSTGLDDQQPRHNLTLNEYGIAKNTVTNAEYKVFCDMTRRAYPPEGGANQPAVGYFLNYPDYPVVGISWYDAVRYCNWLSEQNGLAACYDTTNWSYNATRNGYHLPTEAQWERAARGNLDRKLYPWGDDPPSNRCNYREYAGEFTNLMPNFSNGRGPLPGGKFLANGWGLNDMAGNVWEWCQDWYLDNYYYQSPAQNPSGPQSGTEKVIRGGAWNKSEAYLPCAVREKKTPATKSYDLGFRIAR